MHYGLIIIFFFSFLFVFISSNVIHYVNLGHGYILGDWLINYEDGGFKRRGLSGSLLFKIQNWSNMKLQSIICFIQIILYFSFFILLYKSIHKKKIDLIYLTLIFSPFSFLFYLNDSESIGRKEIILFLLFLIYTFCISKHKPKSIEKMLIIFFIVSSILIHELVFFFIPYFIILYLVKYPRDILFPVFILTFSVTTILIIYFFGKQIDEGNSIFILKSRGVSLSSDSIFSFNQIKVSSYIIQNINQFILYVPSVLLMCLQLFWCVKYFYLPKIFGILFLVSFIFSIPLFLLALDWGRWINVHMILMIIIINSFIPTEREKYARQYKKFKVVYLLIFFSMPLFYSMRHTFIGFSTDTYIYRILSYYI